jgi:hypothetical protein
MVVDKEVPPADRTVESVRFSLDGMSYEVELREEDADELRRALGRYIRCARRVEYPERDRAENRADWSEGRMIREWARDAGVMICERGAIPKAVVSAYRKEMSADLEECPVE